LAAILDVNVADLVSIDGGRPHDPTLTDREAEQPRRGRKPKRVS
jgi:hypothetical protein